MRRLIPACKIVTASLLAALALAFAALGIWQLERRTQKLALIATVNARVHAPPVPPPGPAEWPRTAAAMPAYRALSVHGTFAQGADTLVQAVTDLGPGFWVMTPLRTDAGWLVLVNRGFVADRKVSPAPPGPLTVTGLLRLSEPRGGFLHANDPATGRWYSRDVAQIGRARRLTLLAPYFIDAGPNPDPAQPRGGLTVIAFANNHLQYALTWFALAVLAFLGAWRAARS